MGNRRPLIFAVAGTVFACLLLIILLVLPKMGDVSDANGTLEEARTQEQTLLSQKEALEDAKDRAGENKRIIADAERQVPPVVDEQGVIVLLSNAAEEAGLEVVGIAPADPVFNDVTGITTISVTVSALGTYFDITEFTYLIETLPRAAKTMSVSLAPVAEDSPGIPELTMAGTIEFYTSDTSAGPGSVPGPTEGNGG